jgi:hypothetical protein
MAEGMTTTDHNIVSLYSVASLPDEYVFRTCAIDTVTPSSPPRTLSMLQAYCQQIVQFALYCHHPSTTSSSTTSNENTSSSRILNATNLLQQTGIAVVREHTKLHHKLALSSNEQHSTSTSISYFDILGDVLWMESTIIIAAKTTTNTPPSSSSVSSSSVELAMVRYQLLVDLLKSLRLVPSSLEDNQKRYAHLFIQLLQSTLWMNMDITLLSNSGWLDSIHGGTATTTSINEWQKKLRQYNTQHYYKQTKFNLLVEETRGFAIFLQLITTNIMLKQQPLHDNNDSTSIPSTAIQQRCHIIDRLITTRCLDPARCLDLVIDVLERLPYFSINNVHDKTFNNTEDTSHDFHTQQKELLAFFSTLLGASNNDRSSSVCRFLPTTKLPELFSFRIRHRLKSGTNGASTTNNHHHTAGSTSATLDELDATWRVMSWLVACHVLDFATVLTFFAPWKETLCSVYTKVRVMERDVVAEMGKVRLGVSDDRPREQLIQVKMNSDTTYQSNIEVLVQNPFFRWLPYLLLPVTPYIGHANDMLETTSNMDAWSTISTSMTIPMQVWAQVWVVFPNTCGVQVLDWLHETQILPLLSKFTHHHHDLQMQSLTLTATNAGDMTPWATVPLLVDVLDKINPWLFSTFESGCIRFRPGIYASICRLLDAYQRHYGQLSDTDSSALLKLLQSFLVPSLSLFSCNPSLSSELWCAVARLSYVERYNLYASWQGGALEKGAIASKKVRWLVARELVAGKEVRYALKRLSKDTIRDSSRSIAKVCHYQPLVVFSSILNQIESYDNLVHVIVDALRYVTALSLDVLAYCILSRLSGDSGQVNRSRLKEDGLNLSQWLQSLELFIGSLYKRYPQLELQAIMSYLMNRLTDGHVMELGVLRTLLKTAGGWAFADYSPVASLSGPQLEGRAGSTLLKRETMSFGVFESFSERASRSIRSVLHKDDIGVRMLILLAQVRHRVVLEPANGPTKPVKLLGNLFDMCQVTMSLLLDFLTNVEDLDQAEASDDASTALSLNLFAKSMPTLTDLQRKFGLDVASIWMLSRPILRVAMRNDLDGKTLSELSKDVERYKLVDRSTISFEGMLPSTTWRNLSSALFTHFYTYELYDIYCPEEVYKNEIVRLKAEGDRLQRLKQTQSMQEQVDERELRRIRYTADKIAADVDRHKQHLLRFRNLMQEKRGDYFSSTVVSVGSMSTFLSECVFPRCMQSPDDALYCARFCLYLHEITTPGFGTIQFLDVLVVTLARALFGMTEGEAANSSILLLEVWKQVSRWRYEKDAFESDIVGTPGSFMVRSTIDEGKESGEVEDSTDDATTEIDYDNFGLLYNKWHATIGATFLGCLQSTEYMHTRNSLIVLSRIVDVFPTRPRLGRRLLKALEPLQDDKYPLADLKVCSILFGL